MYGMRKTTLVAAAALGVALATTAFGETATTSAEPYLDQAKTAIQQRHRLTALMAVNNAEDAVAIAERRDESHATRNVGDGEPKIERELGRAREAIQLQHWNQAAIDVDGVLANPIVAMDVGFVAGNAGTGRASPSAPGAPMTAGNPPMPFQNTLPPNGGVVVPNGGIMSSAPNS